MVVGRSRKELEDNTLRNAQLLHLAGGLQPPRVAEGDVLYMSKGQPVAAAETIASQEGHGPDRWLRVVVEFAGDFDRVVTVFSQTVDPRPSRSR